MLLSPPSWLPATCGAVCALGLLSMSASAQTQLEGPRTTNWEARHAQGRQNGRAEAASRLLPGLDDAVAPLAGEPYASTVDPQPAPGTDADAAASGRARGASAADWSIDRSKLYYVEGVDGTWVRGATYKACANGEGFSYTPFLGSEAPRSYPVRFRLSGARLDRRELALNEEAVVSQTGDRFVLDRGDVEVRYDLELDQVEQSFAIDAAGAAGDLVLTLDVTTELLPAAQGAGFVFDGPSGGMRYGAATVLDSSGRSAHVDARWVDGDLSLTVPATFLREAEGMIIVDPILSSYSIDSAAGFQRDVEVSYDLTEDSFFWVCEDRFSGTDIDIYTVQRDAINGDFISGGYFEAGGETYFDPAVANLNSADLSLVVCRRTPLANQSQVVGRLFDHATRTFGPMFVVGNSSPQWIDFQPDVGGNSSSDANSAFMVVWTREFNGSALGRGRLVYRDGTVGSLIALTQNPGFMVRETVVSESTGHPSSTNHWNVCMLGTDNATNVKSLQVRQLAPDGSAVIPLSTAVTLAAGTDVRSLDVSDSILVEGAERYAIAYDNPHQEDTYIAICTGGTALRTVDLHSREHADLGRYQAYARLSTTRDEFLVTYLERSGGGFTAFLTVFDVTEGRYMAISERRVRLGYVGTSPHVGGGAAMASRFSGGNYSSRYTGIGWESGDGDNANLVGVTHFASHPLSPALQYCYGTPNSTGDRGFIRMEGTRSATSPKALVASAVPPGAVGFFIAGTGFADTPNPGGSAGVLCVGGSVGRYSNLVQAIAADGTIEIPFDPLNIAQPSGPVTGMIGDFWQFSLWHRDSVGGAATSNFTNAVSIQLN